MLLGKAILSRRGVLFLLFVLVGASLPVMAQTTVPAGTIAVDTTWDVAGSPYTVEGIVVVEGQDGADSVTTLTIDEGVTVLFDPGAALDIGVSDVGALVIVDGGGSAPIFTSSNIGLEAAGDWFGLTFFSMTDVAITQVDFIDIRYGGGDRTVGGDGSLTVDGSDPTLNNISVQDSLEHGISFVNGSNPTLTDVAVTTTGLIGVSYAAAGADITNLTVTNAGSDGVYAGNGSSGAISNATIITPTAFGIQFVGTAGVTFDSCPQIDRAFTFTGAASSGGAITNSTINNWDVVSPAIPLNSMGRVLATNTINNLSSGTLSTSEGNAVNFDGTWPTTIGGQPFILEMPAFLTYIAGQDGGDNLTTLIVQEDVEVRFPVIGGLNVGNGASFPGALVVQGTNLNPVLFTSLEGAPAAGDWNGLNLTVDADGTPGSIDYLTVRYGGRASFGNDAGVRVSGTNLVLNDVRSENSLNHGFTFTDGTDATLLRPVAPSAPGAGFHIINATGTITDATLTDSGGHGINVLAGSPAIAGGTVSNSGGNGLRIVGSATPGVNVLAISGSTNAAVYSSSTGTFVLDGLAITTPGTVGIELVSSSPTIQNSSITGGSNGLMATTSSPTLDNVSIINPTGYGLDFSGATSATIQNCPRLDKTFFFDNTSGNNTFTSNVFNQMSSFIPQMGASDVHSLVNGGNTFNNMVSGNDLTIMGETIATDSSWPRNLGGVDVTYHVVSGIVAVQGVDGGDFVTTLTLAPGIRVEFDNSTGLDIAPSATPGALIADGDVVNPVTLTSSQGAPAGGDWYGLFMANPLREDVTVIDFLVVEYGGEARFGSWNACLRLDGNDQLITNSTFRESGHTVVTVINGGPTFQGCNISGGVSVGMFLNEANAVIDTCSITNNTLHGLWFGPGNNASTINNCTIDGGLYESSGSSANSYTNSTLTGFGKNTSRLAAGAVSGILSEGGNVVQNCEGLVTAEILGGTLSNDAVWPGLLCAAPATYKIIDDGVSTDITVSGTDGPDLVTTWTVEAGATIGFAPGTLAINVGNGALPGAIVLNGSLANPITLTSSSLTPARGDWHGLYLGPNNNPAITVINYVDFAYGGNNRFNNNRDANLLLIDTSATVTNSTVRESGNHGISLEDSNLNISDSEIYNNNGDGIYSWQSTLNMDNTPVHDVVDYGVNSLRSKTTIVNGSDITNVGDYGLYYDNNFTDNFVNIDGITLENGFFGQDLYGYLQIDNSTIITAPGFPFSLGAADVGDVLFDPGNTVTGSLPGDVVTVFGEGMRRDARWGATLGGAAIEYYVSSGSLVVEGIDGPDFVTTLILDPGVTIKFNEATTQHVQVGLNQPGALSAIGTLADPIVFTSNALVPARGDWGRVIFYAGNSAALSRLEYVEIHYGGNSIGALQIDETSLVMDHVTITESGSAGIYSWNSYSSIITASNLVIDGVDGRGFYGDDVTLNWTDCQISNTGDEGLSCAINLRGTIDNLTITNPDMNGSGAYGFASLSTSYANLINSTVDNSLRFDSVNGNNVVTGSTFNDVGAFPPILPANETGPILFFSGNTFNDVTPATSIQVMGERLSTDTTWQATLNGQSIVYQIINADLDVYGNDGPDGTTTLVLDPDVTLAFNAGLDMTVGWFGMGALVADGTPAMPITFTTSNPAPAPGQWDNLHFGSDLDPAISILDNCIVEYTGGLNDNGALTFNSTTGMQVSNVILRDGSQWGIELTNSNATFTNVTIENMAERGVYISGDNGNLLSTTGTFNNVTINNTGFEGMWTYDARPVLNNVQITNVGASYYGLYLTATSYLNMDGCTVDHGITFNDEAGTSYVTNSTFNNYTDYPSSFGARDMGRILFASGNTFNGVVAADRVTALGEDMPEDTTWEATLTGQPIEYVVTADTNVRGVDGPDGVTTLTLDPGTKVVFNTNVSLRIGSTSPGALIAAGTVGQPILFTSSAAIPAPGDWEGLRFQEENNSAISILQHAVIEYGGQSSIGAGNLYQYSNSLTISDVVSRFSGSYGVRVSSNAILYATNLDISDSVNHGLYNDVSSSVTVNGGTITNAGGNGYYSTSSSTNLTNVNVVNPTNWGFFFENTGSHVLDTCSSDHAFSWEQASGNNSITNSTFNDVDAWRPSIPSNDLGAVLWTGGNTFNDVAAGTRIRAMAQTINRDAIWPATLGGQPIELILGGFDWNDTSGIHYVQGADGADSVTTLTLLPGTTLRFESGTDLYVGWSETGALNATGTPAEPILMTSHQDAHTAGYWGSLGFYDWFNGSLSNMSYVTLEYGGASSTAQMYLDDMAITMDHITIRYSGGPGIYSYRSGLTLLDSEISNTGRRGVDVYQGFVNIDPTSIHDTGWEGIYLNDTTAMLDQVTVYNVANGYYGIRFNSTSNAVVTNSSFENSLTFNSAAGSNSFVNNTFSQFTDYLPSLPANEVGQILFDGGNTFNDVSPGDQVTVLGETVTNDATWPGGLSNTAIAYGINFGMNIQGFDGLDSVTTLTLSPGSTLRFGTAGLINVGNSALPGAMRAIGTDVQKVTFTADQASPVPGNWYGLYFSSTNSTTLSRLENVLVEYAGRSGWEAVEIYRTALVMDKLTVRDIDDIGIYLNDPLGASLSNLDISDVRENGIYIYSANQGTVSITDSVIDGTGRAGILSNVGTFTLDNVAIQNVDSAYYGLDMTSNSFTNINNVTVEHGFRFNSAVGDNVITNSTFTNFSQYPPTIPSNEIGQILFSGGNTFMGVLPEDEIFLLAEDISSDATWPASLGGNLVHFVFPTNTTTYVRGNDGPDFVTTLTLNPGVTLKFGINAGLTIGQTTTGALNADGLPAAPITFTSSALTPVAGDWRELLLNSLTNEALTIIDNCVFEYGGRSVGPNMHLNYTNLDITNSIFRESVGDGLELEYAIADVFNSQFYNNGASGMFVNSGADGTVTNSTFTNNNWGVWMQSGTNYVVGGDVGLGNDFLNNTTSAVHANNSTMCVDATYNFWGDAAGPNDGNAADDGCMGPVSNVTAGDNVTQDVSYAPFAATLVNRPTPPDLLTPANPSEVATLTPTLVLTDSPSAVDTYTFELATDLAFSQNVLTSSTVVPGGGGTTSWTVTPALIEDTLYFWRAKATNGNGDSAWTTKWRFYVNATNNAPFAPTLLAPGDGDITSDTTPNLNLANAADRDDSIVTDYPLTYEFRVYDDVGETNQVAFVTGRAEGGGGATNWNVTPSLPEDTQYWWKARANDGVNDGDWSSTFTFWVNANNSAPTTPVISSPADGTDVGLTGPALTVTNSTDSDGDVLTYDFQIYADNNLTILVEIVTGITEGGGSTAYTVTATLEESEIYYWRARAFDGFTWSPWTATSSFETQGFALAHAAVQGYKPGEDTDRPEEVRYTFSGRTGDATLVFEGYDLDANELEVSINGAGTQAVAVQVNDGWSTQLQVTFADALVNDATENLVVFDNLLSPGAFEDYALRNVDLLKPQMPQNVSATAYNTVIDIAWDANTDGMTVGYNLYRATNSGGPWTQVNGPLLTETLYRDMSLTNGTLYYYYVEAEAADTTISDPSPEVSATPSAAVVTPITDLVITKVGNDIRLTFTVVSNSPGITEYRIYRDGVILDDSNVDAGIGLLGTDADGTYDDVGAGVDGNTYFYEVRPYDGTNQATN